jgi:DNA-binding response OmpR family regulator
MAHACPTLDQCRAKIRYHDLVEGTFDIDDIKVSTHYLNHPALTLGYRLEADGVAVVYACDHEPYSRMVATGDAEITGQDLRHAEFVNGADLLIHDAQYTADEYPSKVGWGHSSVEYVVKLSRFAQVKKVALTHHDPLRDDDAIDRLVADVRTKLWQDSSSLDVFAAFEGQVVEVAASPAKGSARCVRELQAEMPIEPGLAKRSVLLAVADTTTSAALSEAVRAEGLCARFLSNIDEARTLIANDRPSLAILEHDPPRINGMDICRAIRRQPNDDEHRLPVVIVAGQEDQESGAAAGVTDWLIKPFTGAYARTKIRAWALRTACQLIRTGALADAERRLASPRAMQILEAEPGHRFDRITDLHPVPQKRTERRDLPKRAMSSDKSALLWMYGRAIASFDTPAFSRRVGEIIVRAASTAPKRAAGRGK